MGERTKKKVTRDDRSNNKAKYSSLSETINDDNNGPPEATGLHQALPDAAFAGDVWSPKLRRRSSAFKNPSDVATTVTMAAAAAEDTDSFSYNEEGVSGVVTAAGVSPAVYLFAGCAAWNSCILGYDLGVNALSVLLVQKSLDLSDVQIETYVGALDLFSILGALSSSFVNDQLGRRGSFTVASLGFLVGNTVQAFANSYRTLMIGRAILGVSVGYGLAIDPIYISEIAPADRRGELVSWSEIAINVGVILGFASGVIFYGVPDEIAWRYMFAFGSLLPLTMLLLVRYVMPESPRWLLQQKTNAANNNDHEEEAMRILSKLHPDHDSVDSLMKVIKESIEREEQQHQLGWKFLLLNPTPAYRRMLLTGVIAAISQQVVGIDGIGSFLAYVLDKSGIHNRFYQACTMIVLQTMKVIVTAVASKMVDQVGRRILCFVSLGGMVVSLLVLAFDFESFSSAASISSANDSRSSFLTIMGLLGYLVFFGVGMGPCAWLIPSEVFTTPIRAKGMSIATVANRSVSTIMASTFLSLEKAITWSGTFLVLAGLCILMAVLIYLYVPETKGRSLEDMAAYFATITGDQSTILDQRPRHPATAAADMESSAACYSANSPFDTKPAIVEMTNRTIV